ncbi:MAG TPA: porin family protein [Cyclobacteriaceae bacterium]
MSLSITHGQNFSMGLKLGPSLTWSDFADKEAKQNFNTEPKVGYLIDGIISFPLKNNYSFFSEFGFKQTGRIIKFNDDTWENNATYRFIDLSMALRKSFKVRIKKDVSTRCFVNIGPNINYWLAGKGKVETKALGSDYEVVFDREPDANFRNNYMNNVNRWLYGMDIGVGTDANITKTQRLLFELRFTYGHTYIGKKTASSTIDLLGFQDNLKSNFKTLTFTACYFFDFDMRKSKFGKSTKDREIKRRR